MKAPGYFFEPMDDDAPEIAARHYEAPHEVHDMVNDHESYPDRDAVEVGPGLRRDLTGEGLGFLPAGLAFARRCYAPVSGSPRRRSTSVPVSDARRSSRRAPTAASLPSC
jgi:hypothetical protein